MGINRSEEGKEELRAKGEYEREVEMRGRIVGGGPQTIVGFCTNLGHPAWITEMNGVKFMVTVRKIL